MPRERWAPAHRLRRCALSFPFRGGVVLRAPCGHVSHTRVSHTRLTNKLHASDDQPFTAPGFKGTARRQLTRVLCKPPRNRDG